METESKLIIYAPMSHRLEGSLHHIQRCLATAPFPVTKQKEEIVRGGEFWGFPEASVLSVKVFGKLLICEIQCRFI